MAQRTGHETDRRNFLKIAPFAAAAVPVAMALPGLASPLTVAAAQAPGGGTAATFQVIEAADMASSLHTLQGAPAAKIMTNAHEPELTMTLQVEEKKTAAEFEYHAHRDHIFQILDGTTRYEVGGTPKGSHLTKPGEWLAPSSEGFRSFTLKKGDVIVIPRMTPHRRITEAQVSFTLITATTVDKA